MTPGTPTWIPTFTADKKAVENITIDGTQDILGAETVQLTGETQPTTGDYADADLKGGATWADMVSNQFGAKTARNGIKPILKFDHQLARLKFYLRAGNEQAAVNMWDKTTSTWVKRDAPTFTDGKPTDGNTFTSESGVYITRISALNMTNIINLDFTNGVKASRNTTAQATKFNLMSTPESGKTWLL